jgi:hypothetical protein
VTACASTSEVETSGLSPVSWTQSA